MHRFKIENLLYGMLQLYNIQVLGSEARCYRVERGRKLELIEGFEDCIIVFPADANDANSGYYQKILR